MQHSATYSTEDNKLRLYPSCRLDDETYKRVKEAGFSWAPRQELFVAGMWTPEREDLLFDRIVMNPPFENGADIKHIEHARHLLKPGGRLVAICANGPRQRDRLMPLASHWEDLPPGTFKDAGTMVNTALLVIDAA